ncbi:MAG: hypothetical protein F6J90_13340 [Moorea sp. SIOASIH]|uniref:hypothetical protein n=1 Tax=Moorena sp. SIOASIH TaxID=2607817 RepID=UPI0013B6675A|nr:hypothetical protein [Moorena sp. SIOASIH]NEO37250.1 hypothetical protein [Moorena sp. SIOASIH]
MSDCRGFPHERLHQDIVGIFVACSLFPVPCSLFPFLYQFSMGWRQNHPIIQQRHHWSQSDIFL